MIRVFCCGRNNQDKKGACIKRKQMRKSSICKQLVERDIVRPGEANDTCQCVFTFNNRLFIFEVLPCDGKRNGIRLQLIFPADSDYKTGIHVVDQ